MSKKNTNKKNANVEVKKVKRKFNETIYFKILIGGAALLFLIGPIVALIVGLSSK